MPQEPRGAGTRDAACQALCGCDRLTTGNKGYTLVLPGRAGPGDLLNLHGVGGVCRKFRRSLRVINLYLPRTATAARSGPVQHRPDRAVRISPDHLRIDFVMSTFIARPS